MQQFQTGRRVSVLVSANSALGTALGDELPKDGVLYKYAAVVGSRAQLNPNFGDGADAPGGENEYMIATLNNNDEAVMFVAYFDAAQLVPDADESLVENLREDLEEAGEFEQDEDESGILYSVLRDDLEKGTFEPDGYDGEIQLVRLKVDGEVVNILPAESLSVVAQNLNAIRRFTGTDSPVLTAIAGVYTPHPDENADENVRAVYVPEFLSLDKFFNRDEIVQLGRAVIDYGNYEQLKMNNAFVEACENIPALPAPKMIPTIFESQGVIIESLRDSIFELADLGRLTVGSDIVLELEVYVGPASDWDNHGFDPSFELEDEDDEDDLDDEDDSEDDSEGELAPDSEQPKPGTMTEEIANNLQTAFSSFADSLPESLGAPVEIVSTNTVFSSDLALVTIAVATKEDAAEVGPMVESLESAISSMLVGEPDYTAALMECEPGNLIAFANYFGLNADDSMTKEDIVERINDNVDASEIEEFLEG